MDLTSIFFSLPAITGDIRALFYLGLLILIILDSPSPFQAPQMLSKVSPLAYTPPRILGFLGFTTLPSQKILRLVRTVMVTSWLFAMIGFLQPVSAIVTFLCFAFLHAANSGSLGSNHSTHSALYALFALCFSVSHDIFSMDYFLFKKYEISMLVNSDSVLESGFAKYLLLISLIYIMLAGGIAKLKLGGIKWLDGEAFYFYIKESASFARSPRLSKLLRSHPLFFRSLPKISVLIEISGVLALFDHRLILPIVIIWILFHIGILLVMMPAYWVQMWCYLPLLDWYSYFGMNSAVTWDATAHSHFAIWTLNLVGVVYCAVLFFVFARNSEEWPFTSVPMYSNGTPPSQRCFLAKSELQSKAKASLNGDIRAWIRPWMAPEADEDIQIVPVDKTKQKFSLFALLAHQGALPARWSQWAKVIRKITLEDLVAKPEGQAENLDPNFPAAKFLKKMADFTVERVPSAAEYSHLEWVCRTKEGLVVIAKETLTQK